MKTTKLILPLLGLGLLSACQNESDNLKPAPVQYAYEKSQTDGVKIEINPRVDILFVIDNSGSMKPHIAKLTQNIDRFVEGIGKNSLLDFHIGAMAVWDSRRYGQYDVESNKVVSPGVVPAMSRDNKPLFEPIGHLRALKAPAGKEASLAGQGPNYVKRGQDFVEILRETLNIGVSDYQKVSDNKKDAQGPEYEEVFTPVLAALREPQLSTWNKGFLRPGKEAHLVVVLVTDANDASDVSADQMFRFLTDLKGRGNFTLFSIINPTLQPIRSCPRDPAGPPWKIEDLMLRARGKVLNICGDYAQQLLEIGQLIQDRTLGEIRQRVNSIPVVDKTIVRYGNQEIPVGQSQGWTYDADTKEIVIRGASKWPYQPNAKIEILFEGVDPTRHSSQRIEQSFRR